MSDKQTTASGRQVKRVGINDTKLGALASLSKLRKEGGRRTEQYQVSEAKKVFEEMDEDDYDRRQADHNNDDFIVDDDGYGYQDRGGEVWEVNDDGEAANGKKKNKRKKIEDGRLEQMFFNAPQHPRVVVRRKAGTPGVHVYEVLKRDSSLSVILGKYR